MRHLQEKQIGELLRVIAIGETIAAQDVAVVPKFLNDGGGRIGGSATGPTSVAAATTTTTEEIPAGVSKGRVLVAAC